MSDTLYEGLRMLGVLGLVLFHVAYWWAVYQLCIAD